MADCVHEIEAAWCSISNGTDRRAEEERTAREARLRAAGFARAWWPGSCCRCGDGFEPGDFIRRDPDGKGWIAAACCGPDDDTTRST